MHKNDQDRFQMIM